MQLNPRISLVSVSTILHISVVGSLRLFEALIVKYDERGWIWPIREEWTYRFREIRVGFDFGESWDVGSSLS